MSVVTSSTCKSRASILSSNANFSTALCSSSLILSPSLIASSMVPFSSRILDTLSSILPRVPRSPLRNPLLPLPPCLALRRFLLRLRMIQRLPPMPPISPRPRMLQRSVQCLGLGRMGVLTQLQTASKAEESTDGDENAKTTLLPDGCQLHMSMWAPENYKKRIAMAAKPAPIVTNPAPVVINPAPIVAKSVPVAAKTTLLPDGCQLHMSMWAPENCKKRAAMAAKPAPVATNPTPAVAKSVPVAAKVVKFAQNAGRNGIKISPATSTTKARSYSSGELLHLRSSLPAINGVASKFKNNPHIARIETAISYTEKKTRGHEEVAVSHGSKAEAFVCSGAVDFTSRSSLQWLWGVCAK
ncbi:hypothetical protein BGZ57DRAFT_585740 [Hyaloscypha finlandica]|nr:hypothetical protein BGZ57DRAFT_585740 [Hyaloscypha finlandica]